MWEIIVKAFSIIFIIALGYVMKKRGIFKVEDRKVLSNMIFMITLPCVLISSFKSFQYSNSLIISIFVGLGINLVMLLVGYLFARKRDHSTKGLYMMNCCGYNIGTFTFPFVASFLDASSMIIVAMFDIGNAIMSLGGTYAITAGVTNTGDKGSFGEFFKRLFSSIPFITYMTMLLLSLIGIRLPAEVYTVTDLIGGATTFLVMFMIGIIFEIQIPKEDIKDVGAIVAIRYIGSLLFAILIYRYLPIPEMYRKVLMISVFAPNTAIAAVFCQKLGCKPSVAGVLNSICIPISLVCITLLLVFIK
ncbi:MAG: AEC family transporter [Lachnospiraceae bacterium]|nr:AEC family transporter [Lachnospiraceae bacterium]